MFSHYLTLTKPRISLLFAITGLTVFMMEGSLRPYPLKMWTLVLAIFLVGGAANALNQYFERERDKQMARTAKKRPLPQGLITPNQALVFIFVIGITGNFLLFYLGNLLALAWGLGTIAFYSFFYTLYLKPRTPYNIVIGGIAGATAPFIAWAVVQNGVAWIPFILFLIIFLWTPPHFWALALACKDDYSKVSLPMLPNVKGEPETRRQILIYSYTLLPASLALLFTHSVGWLYVVSATVLGILFIIGAHILRQRQTQKVYWQFFAFSILYLMLIFVILIFDTLYFKPL